MDLLIKKRIFHPKGCICIEPKHVLNVPTDLEDPEDWLVSDKDKEVGGKSRVYQDNQ